MKLFVDEMPEEPSECPYSRTAYDEEEETQYHICSWNNCGNRCDWTDECPFFTTKEE